MNFELLYTTSNTLLVNHVRNLLEAEGITVRMKNEFLGGGAGELPPTEAWPELWVAEADYPAAKRVVDELGQEHSLPAWRCPACGESIEGQFSACWNCGASRPSEL
ncbi:MAG: DUF2007 domain-containing protein [Gammaproteobacteria bacterium]|nr:DUF2007 domain-containing protein [Gammaproteobacteria bacterium]MCW8973682.1 DUF2007 domain-containing protein [Gammaproteobacteria bacterium]MCW8993546.1 DUF2007 domain-containing protein [Gammaproteobacteria bacterium]